MDKTQREYILREQLKAIQRELGEDDPQQAEVNELRDKVEAAGMPDEIKARAIKEIDRMSRIPSASPEVGVIRTYVDWLVGLPWDTSTDDQLDIKMRGPASSTRTTTAWRRSRSASSSTSRCAPWRTRSAARSWPSSARPAWARPRWASRSPRRWAASSCG